MAGSKDDPVLPQAQQISPRNVQGQALHLHFYCICICNCIIYLIENVVTVGVLCRFGIVFDRGFNSDRAWCERLSRQ